MKTDRDLTEGMVTYRAFIKQDMDHLKDLFVKQNFKLNLLEIL